MACPDCNNEKVDCGCITEALSINQVCNPVDCDTTECTEVFDAKCIIHTSGDIVCDTDIVVPNNTNLSSALALVVEYFCDKALHEVAIALTCGEDTVVPAGTDIDQSLKFIVSYFCNRLSNLEATVGSNTTALLNTVQVTQTTAAPDALGCRVTTTQITFRDNGNNVIDTVSFDNTTCTPNTYGLFSQTDNSASITSTNTSDSLFATTYEGSLDIAANTFQVGQAFRLFGAGHITKIAPASDLQIQVLFNASVELDIAIPIDAITDLHWNMEIDFVIRSEGGSGTVMTSLRFHNEDNSGSDSAHTHMETTLANVDTTIPNTLDVRATWVSPVAGDEIYSEIMNLHKIF